MMFFVFGYFGYKSLNSAFFPETPSKLIQVQVIYPGASPEEVEEGVIIKIEENLKGVTGIERFSSVSQENTGTIKVEVLKEFDTDLVLQDVKNAVDRINSFPSDIEPPVVYKVENLNLAISFAISGVNDLKVLKSYACKVEKDLLAFPGLSKVEVEGFPEEEIEIAFREEALQAYSISFAEAALSIQKSNIELTGGTVKSTDEELLIRSKSKKYYGDELGELVMKTTERGEVVRLKHIAEIRDTWSDVPNRSYLNKQESVIIKVSKTIDEDILYVADVIKKYIIDFNEKNQEVQATIVQDGTVNLVQRIELLTKNGVVGFFLVLIFLAFFLNARLAFWVALSIPISFAGMFILAAYYGLTINVMSLFGMILVVGILVDDGIVIGENIYQHYEMGKTANQAAIDGTLEVLPAVFSAILTTVVAFSTFFFIDGRLGDFAPSLAFVVICTLLISLVEGIFILPAHIAHSKSLQGELKKSKLERFFDNIMNYGRRKIYEPAFAFSLKNKFFSLAIFIAIFMVTIGGISGGLIKFTFFPFIERDTIVVDVEMQPGTREHLTQEVLDKIEAAALRVNERFREERPDGLDIVEMIEKKIGPGTNQGNVKLILLDNERRNMQSFKVANVVREEAGPLPEADKISFGQNSPFGKAISVSLLSNNLNELEKAKNALQIELNNLASLTDVVNNDKRGIREITITLKDKAYLLGLQTQDVIAQVRQGFFGFEVQRLQRGVDEVKVWVRYDENVRSSLGDLENMRIRFGDGKEVPLREIADYTIERGTVSINHLDGQREINIEAELSNPMESAPEIMSEIESVILPPILNKYSSVRYSFEGQSRQSEKTQSSIKSVVPIILILMISIVILTFRSFTQAITIFIVIPLGFIGVGWGHWLHGMPISLLSFFGIIGLVGIMVNDSLVLVSALNRNIKSGKDFYTSVFEAGSSRFRAIVLTTVTTIAGLAPLILEKSFQAQFLVPMAISIAYGLFIATFTTLFVLPILLYTLNDIKVYLNWFWEGKKPDRLSQEPAYIELLAEQKMEKETEDLKLENKRSEK